MKWRRLWHIQQHFSVNIQMALGYFDSDDGLFPAQLIACCYINFPFNLLLMLVFLILHPFPILRNQQTREQQTPLSELKFKVEKSGESLKLRASGSIKLQQNSTHNTRETRLLMKVLCRAEKCVNRNLSPNLCVGKAN